MELLKEYFTPWIISNGISVVILIAAIRKPKWARFLFALVFTWACWINYKTSHSTPESYLEYAMFTPFTWYKNFINTWFSEHVTGMVTAIAVGQGFIALGMLLKGWWVRVACFGAIVFFLAIAPLGIGSGFPATLISAVAVYFILKKDDFNYLWRK